MSNPPPAGGGLPHGQGDHPHRHENGIDAHTGIEARDRVRSLATKQLDRVVRIVAEGFALIEVQPTPWHGKVRESVSRLDTPCALPVQSHAASLPDDLSGEL